MTEPDEEIVSLEEQAEILEAWIRLVREETEAVSGEVSFLRALLGP